MLMKLVIKFAGESGQGINSLGDIFAKVMKRRGLKVMAYREYPSLIRGGYASYQVDIATSPIQVPSRDCQFLFALSREAFNQYFSTVVPQGRIFHTVANLELTPEQADLLSKRGITVTHLNTYKPAMDIGKNKLFMNMVLSGFVAKLLNLPIQALENVVSEVFADKPDLLQLDLECLKAGYEMPDSTNSAIEPLEGEGFWSQSLLMTGNEALALGAIAAGMRAYYAYPMTPSSSILSYLADVAHSTGVLVKQAEDEITAAQMALGSMFMGTRALVATSGGGFDLMTETVSLAGMTETPFLCVIAQRPGPATGMPTWTATGDLNLAIYSGHGEFPRCVIAASDATSCFTLIQKAFDLAEKYQIPVILLTDKHVAETKFNISEFPATENINRYISTGEHVDSRKLERYAWSEDGISSRWLPGSAQTTYLANSDEHLVDGTLTEEATHAKRMMDKRLAKGIKLAQHLPEPILYGKEDSKVLFVGWGSVKGAMLDALDLYEPGYAYLHYEYLYPLRTELLSQIASKFIHVVVVEQNATGQFESLLKQQITLNWGPPLRKYDGRPLYAEDVFEYMPILESQQPMLNIRVK